MRFRGILLASIMLAARPAMALPLIYPHCGKSDASFSSFLDRFTDDIGFQRSRIAFPLVVRSGDGVTVESSVDLWAMDKVRQQKDPLIYSRAQRHRLHLEQSIGPVSKEPALAGVFQSSAGESDTMKLQYWFRMLDGCWYLAEFDDWSE